jgi:DNA-binding response OmpR family regulator
VDDNRDAAESMAMFLQTLGHEVVTAHDGVMAIEQTERFQPEVILLDIGLPKLNGYQVAERIRASWGADMVLIALTGWGQEEDRRRSSLAGMNHHLTKPVNFDELNRLMAEVKPNTGPQ